MEVSSYKWDAASTLCQSLNSEMVIISTEEENDFTVQLAKVFLNPIKVLQNSDMLVNLYLEMKICFFSPWVTCFTWKALHERQDDSTDSS